MCVCIKRSHVSKKCACSMPGAIIFPPFLRLRVDGRKRFEYATCGREEKTLRFQKYPHTCGQGLNCKKNTEHNNKACNICLKNLSNL